MAEGGTVGQVVRVTWIEGERAASSGACGKGVPPPHHNNNGGGEIPGVREVADEPEEFRVIAEFRVLAPDFGTYLKQIMLDEYDFMEEITLAEEVEEAAASKLKHKSSTTATAVAGAGKILAPAGGGGAATTTAAVGRSPSPSTSPSSSTSDSPNGSMVSSASAEADVMQTQTAAIHSPHHHSGGGVHGAGDPATTPTAESKHLTEGLRVAATVVSAAAMTTKETDKDDRKAPIMPVESDGAGHGVTAREINPHGAAGAGARSIPRSTPSQSSSAAPASSPVWTSSRLAVAPEESGSEEDDDEEDEELEEDEEDLEDEDLVLQAMIKT